MSPNLATEECTLGFPWEPLLRTDTPPPHTPSSLLPLGLGSCLSTFPKCFGPGIFLFFFVETKSHVTQAEGGFAIYPGGPWASGPPASTS